MKRKILAAAALAIAMGPVPLAQAAQPGDTSCLQPARLEGWDVVNDRTIIVTDRLRRSYKISLFPGCINLKFAFGLAFRPFSRSGLSCMGKGDTVVAPADAGLPRQTCRVDSVVAYTPDMQHADAVNKALDGPH